MRPKGHFTDLIFVASCNLIRVELHVARSSAVGRRMSPRICRLLLVRFFVYLFPPPLFSSFFFFVFLSLHWKRAQRRLNIALRILALYGCSLGSSFWNSSKVSFALTGLECEQPPFASYHGDGTMIYPTRKSNPGTPRAVLSHFASSISVENTYLHYSYALCAGQGI